MKFFLHFTTHISEIIFYSVKSLNNFHIPWEHKNAETVKMTLTLIPEVLKYLLYTSHAAKC